MKATQAVRASVLALSLLALVAPGWAEAPVTDCDRLASSHFDPATVAPVVFWNALDGEAALEACSAAVRKHRKSQRLRLLHGRAAQKVEDSQLALSILTELDEEGYAPATYFLGLQMFNEALPAGDQSEGIRLVEKAALAGNAEAAGLSSYMYLEGVGHLKKSIGTAIHYANEAERLGASPYMLGWLHNDGRVFGKSFPTAQKYLEEAVQQGDDRAAMILGYAYHVGEKVKKDPRKAHEYYLFAAERGHSAAMENLAINYASGAYIQDWEEARAWYEKAVEKGRARSAYLLAKMLVMGQGGKINVDRAQELFEVALEGGEEKAEPKLQLIREVRREKLAEFAAETKALRSALERMSPKARKARIELDRKKEAERLDNLFKQHAFECIVYRCAFLRDQVVLQSENQRYWFFPSGRVLTERQILQVGLL